MELKEIRCPSGNVEHAIDPETFVCVTCGQESIEWEQS